MGFFAFYRSLSPLTLRQRLRYISLLYKKIRQTHRTPNEIEHREILAQVLNEFDVTLRSVGGLTIAWAEAETFLDYTNGLLAFNPALAELKFPRITVALDQKNDFLKIGFTMIPELTALREQIPELIAELKRLQTIRNDVVHGVVTERTPVAVRKVMRVKASGRFLDETYKTYQLAEIANAWRDVVQLRDKLITLFADTMRILAPDRAKQYLSELPSFSSTAPATPPTVVVQPPTSHQGHRPKALMIFVFINAFAGIVIGAANASWLNVLLASLVWATVIWLVITVIFGRASNSDTLFFDSPTITRFIVWWPISSVTSLIIGSLTYAIRTSLGPG